MAVVCKRDSNVPRCAQSKSMKEHKDDDTVKMQASVYDEDIILV